MEKVKEIRQGLAGNAAVTLKPVWGAQQKELHQPIRSSW